MTNAQFAAGGTGLKAHYSGQFLYRISGIRKLVNFTQWRSPHPYYTDDDIWLRLKLRSDVDGWLPLSEYAEGALTGPRQITWWTDSDPSATDIICAGHLIGLPNDWMAKYSVILRCRINSLTTFAVPSVIDAFDGEIFHPTLDKRMPNEGVTINLEDLNHLGPGAREFVLGEISVGEVMFQPVLVDLTLRRKHTVRLNSILRTRLEEYYLRLGAHNGP